jgi:predicted methyltransferase
VTCYCQPSAAKVNALNATYAPNILSTSKHSNPPAAALTAAVNAAAVSYRLFRWLKPGGKLLVTDYCQPAAAAGFSPSPGFAAYIAKHRYSLLSVDAYAQQLAAAGFADVEAEDCTAEVRQDLLC